MLKKLPLLFLLFHFFQLRIIAQAFDPEKRPKEIISFSTALPGINVFPFGGLVIHDMRYDTSKIGYTNGKISKRAVTDGPFEKAIEEALNNSLADKFDQSSKYRIHFFIKHFWIDGMPEKRIGQTFCRAQIESFLQLDSAFFPLIRFDTGFVAPRQKMNLGQVVLFPYQACLEKISRLSPDSIVASKKKLSLEHILSAYQKSFEYPRLKINSLEKGVYLTYHDFLFNKLTYPELRYEQTLYNDDLYVTSNGGENLINDSWGFCDGHKQFIRLGHNFYQLIRQTNSFELHGPSSVDLLRKKESGSMSSSGLGLGADVFVFRLYSDKSDLLVFKPMQLNMETGKPYGF